LGQRIRGRERNSKRDGEKDKGREMRKKKTD
jgi:hypothetical protein